MKEGLSIVLFDGLDEVNLEGGVRNRINNEVREFSNHYRRSHCVITCRTAANDYQFEHFSYCELADFTRDQMHIFVKNWFQKDKIKCEAFITEFTKNKYKRLIDLSRTPLLLTLLCLSFEETMMSLRAE